MKNQRGHCCVLDVDVDEYKERVYVKNAHTDKIHPRSMIEIFWARYARSLIYMILGTMHALHQYDIVFCRVGSVRQGSSCACLPDGVDLCDTALHNIPGNTYRDGNNGSKRKSFVRIGSTDDLQDRDLSMDVCRKMQLFFTPSTLRGQEKYFFRQLALRLLANRMYFMMSTTRGMRVCCGIAAYLCATTEQQVSPHTAGLMFAVVTAADCLLYLFLSSS